jgi:L-ascorbate metabolism protein UlaG (beta-lactamase superfamily)
MVYQKCAIKELNMRITMIGHSTILIETNGQKILTDPYFGTWGNIAYARCNPPAKSRQELMDIDGVMISHDHWDHVDGRYLRMIGETTIVAPRMTSWLIKLLGGQNVVGMTAWESKKIGEITITAVPAIHLTATIGFVLESEDRRIYFAGDTFYQDFMKEVGRKYELDVALIPVTTYRIPMTMGENGAVKAVQALKPSVVIPIHLGISPRSPILRTNQTPEGFAQRLQRNRVVTKVVQLQEGESYTL